MILKKDINKKTKSRNRNQSIITQKVLQRLAMAPAQKVNNTSEDLLKGT